MEIPQLCYPSKAMSCVDDRVAVRCWIRLGRAFALQCIMCALACAATADTTHAAPGWPDNVLTNRYCTGCHNKRLRTGDLSLEGLDLTKVATSREVWERVLHKLQANEMPPPGLPRPSTAERKQFTEWLEGELDDPAAANSNPGHPTIHRLNRNEYSNAVRDLLSLDMKAGETLPVDDSGYGFDNIGDVLSLSPVLLERYMSIARTVAALAVGDTNIEPVINTFTAPREIRAKGAVPTKTPNERVADDLPFGSAGGVSIQYAFPVDAEYVFKIGLPGSTVRFEDDGAAPIAQRLEFRTRVSAGIHRVGVTFIRSAALPEVGVNPAPRGIAPPTIQVDLRIDSSRLKLYDVPEGEHGPAVQEFSIAGPYTIAGPGKSTSRQKIFVCYPASAAEQDVCAHKILSVVARRAFRRPVTETDLGRLMTVYRAGRVDSTFDGGIELALRAILVSPDFVFRVERDPTDALPGSIHRVSDVELASRLSFFLWSSIPDDQLLTLAEQGKLKDSVVLEQQVTRLLDDPKSKAFFSNFAGQWLYLRNLYSQRPDPDIFPKFDNSLREAFKTETELFFRSIVRENRPVTQLLDANYTFVNQRLAEFYKMHGVYGPQFRRVELTDTSRFGILGQASLLTVTSYPNRASVVQRGKWVLENLLGSPPPPPPPNVPSLDAHGKSGKLSMRQAMEEHRANPACAGCHARMDPIGFALENFDGIGAWRDTDNGVVIDATGKLPDGSVFQGSAGLSRLILDQHRDEFIATFAEKLMTYALGRGIERYDKPALRTIIREAAKQNSTIPAFIGAIVKSPQFQMRRTSP
jgi:hypothetical protein